MSCVVPPWVLGILKRLLMTITLSSLRPWAQNTMSTSCHLLTRMHSSQAVQYCFIIRYECILSIWSGREKVVLFYLSYMANKKERGDDIHKLEIFLCWNSFSFSAAWDLRVCVEFLSFSPLHLVEYLYELFFFINLLPNCSIFRLWVCYKTTQIPWLVWWNWKKHPLNPTLILVG